MRGFNLKFVLYGMSETKIQNFFNEIFQKNLTKFKKFGKIK
jgi:hypothetical protein